MNQVLRSLTLGWFSHPVPDTKKNLIFQFDTLEGRLCMIAEADGLFEQLRIPLFFPPPFLTWKNVTNSSAEMSWLPTEMALKIRVMPIKQLHMLGGI